MHSEGSRQRDEKLTWIGYGYQSTVMEVTSRALRLMLSVIEIENHRSMIIQGVWLVTVTACCNNAAIQLLAYDVDVILKCRGMCKRICNAPILLFLQETILVAVRKQNCMQAHACQVIERAHQEKS